MSSRFDWDAFFDRHYDDALEKVKESDEYTTLLEVHASVSPTFEQQLGMLVQKELESMFEDMSDPHYDPRGGDGEDD